MSYIDSIRTIVDILRKDGVILYPTDTIWGLGGSIYSQKATEKIYEIKNRDRYKALLLLVDSIEMLKLYIEEIHPRVETLMVYHKQPLTIIYKANSKIPDHLLCGGETIAIRVVQDEFCKSLINLLGHPITSTSANLASTPSPSYFNEINNSVIEQADYVVKYRQDDRTRANESVIAKFDYNGNLFFIRS